jgi:aldehyde dehydrogenase (NAD+)
VVVHSYTELKMGLSRSAPWDGERLIAPHYVGGAFLDSDGEQIRVIDPSTEAPLAALPAATPMLVDRAAGAARAALSGPWSKIDGAGRARLLHSLCDLLEQHAGQLVDDVVRETGSPISLASGMQVAGAIDCLRWFADAAERGPVGGYDRVLPTVEGPVRSASRILQEPAGVVAAITAYNYPLLLLARKIGPALASGCTTVVLPSERAPLSTWRFFTLLAQVGYPAGVANLVIGGREAGVALSSHPEVDLVSFTGSVAVGRAVMTQAARTTKKVLLELGGKSPSVILPGADLAAAVAGTIQRFTVAAGQGCGCTTRIFVPQDDLESFTHEARRLIDGVVTGDPFDPRTDMGPLIREEHRLSVEGYVDRALTDGGWLLAGGGRPDLGTGFFVNPAMVCGVSNSSEIAVNELFGPVAVVIPYSGVDSAVALANDSRFGLNAALWGPSDVCLEVAPRISSGTVTINGGGSLRADVPWGGARDSGIGREGGEEGLREYFEQKHIQWPV